LIAEGHLTQRPKAAGGADSASDIQTSDILSLPYRPLRVNINGKEVQITPGEVKQTVLFSEEIKTFEVNRNFYIEAAKSEL
jgi:hypothetical protein